MDALDVGVGRWCWTLVFQRGRVLRAGKITWERSRASLDLAVLDLFPPNGQNRTRCPDVARAPSTTVELICSPHYFPST